VLSSGLIPRWGIKPEESIQHSEHGESLKSRTNFYSPNAEKFFRTQVNYYQTLRRHAPKYKHHLQNLSSYFTINTICLFETDTA
jgi:hypothetical protein